MPASPCSWRACAAPTRGAACAVRPFKPQNMSNNAAVTADGGEIGRAQALQARACGVEPLVDMNPVLLKPQSETGAQVVVQGRVLRSCSARDYHALKPQLLPAVLESFAPAAGGRRSRPGRGGGQPGRGQSARGRHRQHGLRARRRRAGGAGGRHRARRGDRAAGRHGAAARARGAGAAGGLRRQQVPRRSGAVRRRPSRWIEARTGLRSLGVVTWLERARDLPKEDILGLAELAATGRRAGRRPIRVAVPRLPRLANFDDLDPLAAEPDVDLRVLEPGEAPAGATPISWSCPAARRRWATSPPCGPKGWDIDILAHVRRGGWVLGLCGGYQMLGRRIADPLGLEGAPGEARRARAAGGRDGAGAGQDAGPARRGASVRSGEPVRGYEIHMGRTDGAGAGAADAPRRRRRGRRGERRRAGDGLLPARPPRGRRLSRALLGRIRARGGCRRWPTRRGSRRRWTSWPPISSAAWISTGCWRWRARPTTRTAASGDGGEHQPPDPPGQRDRTVDVGGRRLGAAVAHPAVVDRAAGIDARAGEAQAAGRRPWRPRASRRWASGAAARRAAWSVAERRRAAADKAQGGAGEAGRDEVGEIVEPGAGPAELAVALAAVAHHAVQRVDRLVGEHAGQAGDHAPEQGCHDAVGQVLGQRIRRRRGPTPAASSRSGSRPTIRATARRPSASPPRRPAATART